MLWPDTGSDQVLGCLADEKLLEEVERGGEEAQAVEDHGLQRLAAAYVFAGIGAQEVVDLLDQSDLIDDAGHDPEMVDILNFDSWYIRLIHAPENTSACTINLRKVG